MHSKRPKEKIPRPRPVPRKSSANTLTEDSLQILDHFDQVTKNDDGWMARCPAHDDSNPSLSIKQADDGKWLFYCFAGCDHEEIVVEAGLRKTLLPRGSAGPIEATYDYTDEDGNLLSQVVRREPKKFTQRRPNGHGGWIHNVQGVRRVPYNLPNIVESDKKKRIYVVEGEKDADRLINLRLLATTFLGGAGKWKAEYGQYFRNRHVVLLPDNDSPGRNHALRIAEALRSVAASVRALELPGLPEKGDVSDWLDNGGSIKQLNRLVRKCKKWLREDAEVSERRSVEAHDNAVMDFPVEVFPKPLQKLISEGSHALPCPPDFIGVPLLAVLGAAIGQSYRLELKPGYIQSAAVYSAVVARPGDRKSPALDLVTAPANAINRLLDEEYQ